MGLNADLLTAAEQRWVSSPTVLKIGSYLGWGQDVRPQPFEIEVNTTPLRKLIDASSIGSRVYELMAIRRPGDILHYIFVSLIDVGEDLKRDIEQRNKHLVNNHMKIPPHYSLTLTYLDRALSWRYDDTPPYAECWLRHRESRFWRELVDRLFLLACNAQRRLIETDDFLLQHELERIKSKTHWRDWQVDVERNLEEYSPNTDLPEPSARVLNTIIELAKRPNVSSVSCPLNHFGLWRKLVEEQVRRAQAVALPPKDVLRLSGPDSGLVMINANDWGGEIHIPYEGAAPGDVFIRPAWRTFHIDAMKQGGNLNQACGCFCKHLISAEDFGEFPNLSRQVIDGWVLYQNKAT